ncbi:hypothetical protein [Acinetobacter lanii]|uniref:Uncharacterized protein n=1 Tax=Acinetobacter lanii TaxID=2715163 RepID=A0A6G8S4U6_9GAMM|nr:hypothetical protein [Acinetobacter lanii]QIO09175.1 hypothetical protein G8D99_09210 [Acinetobacter lanii]
MYKILNLNKFFKQHPKYPFLNWHIDYDEYCAINLLLLNIVKLKKNTSNDSNWKFKSSYINFRIDGSEGVYYPFGCINHDAQLVLSLGTPRNDEKDFFSMSVSLEKETFYWEAYKYDEVNSNQKFYYELNIYFDTQYDEALLKVDKILDLFFSKKIDELQKLCGYYENGNFSELIIE